MSKTYEIYSRGEEKCWLADTDTFTLALSDCADADIAEHVDETTAEMLAECFDFDALLALAIERERPNAPSGICSKLSHAIRIAAQMPNGMISHASAR